MRALGIDRYVSQYLSGRKLEGVLNYFENLMKVPPLAGEKAIVATYAQLCLDGPQMIKRLGGFLEAELKDGLSTSQLEQEFTGIAQNPRWIGQKWKGSDVAPGRFQKELKASTQAKLTEAFSPLLHQMANLDPDYEHLYLT